MDTSGLGTELGFGWKSENSAVIPSWFCRRPTSVTDCYGVVAAPVFIEKPSVHSSVMWTGGWRGVSVEVPSGSPTERNAVLWRIKETDRSPTEFRSGREPHGWFYPIGLPWYCGLLMFPTELIVFLRDRALESISDIIKEAKDPLKSVFKQFEPFGGGFCLHASILVCDRSPVESGGEVKRIRLLESAICSQKAVCGLFSGCGCDNAGSLQCASHAKIVEDTINDGIGGDKFSRLKLVSTVDGITVLSSSINSGPAFKWTSRPLREPATPAQRKIRGILNWSAENSRGK